MPKYLLDAHKASFRNSPGMKRTGAVDHGYGFRTILACSVCDADAGGEGLVYSQDRRTMAVARGMHSWCKKSQQHIPRG